ncbi:MAG: translation elongation factor Ts [Acidimicrobiia bacterium]
MSFTAKDVQALRQATGAGMMDAKKALVENGGDFDAAGKWLREKGLAKSAERADRANTQGAVAIGVADGAAAVAELKCETDFVAKSEQFVELVEAIARSVAAEGEAGAEAHREAIDDLKVSLKENIELGRVARVAIPEGSVSDTYLHRQEGRGVNGVIVVLDGGSDELAHDVAVHAAFTKPPYLRRADVPEALVAEERSTLESITRAEGKPEQAIAKIVEGRLNAWFKDRVLLEQPFVRDDKQTITQLLGDHELVELAQVYIGS